MRLQCSFQFRVATNARLKNHMRTRLDEPNLVGCTHHGGFENAWMGGERIFHLAGCNVNAANFEHVVGAAAIAIPPITITAIGVACSSPLA